MKFTSKRTFVTWGYTPSHNTLIIRSSKTPEEFLADGDKKDFTIDLEFYDVTYMGMPIWLDCIELTLETILPSYIDEVHIGRDGKIFKLVSDTGTYYIIARGCVVGSSSMDYSECRTDNFGLKYDEIIATF